MDEEIDCIIIRAIRSIKIEFAEDQVRGISGIRQKTHPYGDNGQLNMYAQHKHKKHSKGDNHHPFIGERKYDEDVQGFVVDAINNPLGVERNDEAYPTNGYDLQRKMQLREAELIKK